MKPKDAREEIVKRLEKDLVGPDAVDEVIGKTRRSRPSDFYLTGLLWPIGTRVDESEDDGGGDDSEDGDTQAVPGLIGQQKPCSMGMSFATFGKGKHQVAIKVEFATYEPEEVEDPHASKDNHDGRIKVDEKRGEGDEKNEKKGSPRIQWRRRAWEFVFPNELIPVDASRTFRVEKEGLAADLQLHVRGRKTTAGQIGTVTLINMSRPEQDRVEMERVTLFQVQLEISGAGTTALVPRPGSPAGVDEETNLARLLFRNCHEFAAGHQCSVGWDAEGMEAKRIWTSWIPTASVPAFREDGHECFSAAIKSRQFDADGLGSSGKEDLQRRLSAVANAYKQWIKGAQHHLPDDPELRKTAVNNLERCTAVLERIRSNIERIASDDVMRDSFQLAMQSMALQFGWRQELEAKANGVVAIANGGLRWRPFQLAFIVLAGVSACDRNALDREILDLLWFPTGGGKTEAYLAIVAMLAFHRRLSNSEAEGMGNAAVMRYTLRLLTAQQFERAASLILAAELIRRRLQAESSKRKLGNGPFSIGLWVGGDATPNKYADAVANRGQREGSSAEQLDGCPCCGSKVRWSYDDRSESVNPYCENESCSLGPKFGPWPVYTVDSDLYRERPTLVIGTVDKFALMPRRPEMGQLFGFKTACSTDLVIQDELHLISGPLGTMAGLYETAFDWLLSKNGRRPKVIGSTATIRRAEDQVKALFDRTTCQFPPPGLDHDDSGFAVRDPAREGRLYVGITTGGRSAKFALQAAAASLLQSGGPALTPNPEERDGYATLLCYFNSLRELGGAIVQMLDDVPDSIKLYAARRNETERLIGQPRELTSRASQKEIIGTLSDLKRTAAEKDCLDVVLATNMVSVGVDVSRLGMMLVNGQPKTRSEYIQSTSRVGRKDFPGLVVCLLNAAKARDRSHYETFPSWHGTLYRDVEATSVTPFASRARDRALHAVLASMIRHGCAGAHQRPDLNRVTDQELKGIVQEIERRISAIDVGEVQHALDEIDKRLDDWDDRSPSQYLNDKNVKVSLMQSAERHVRRRAAGMYSGAAWPVMNNMRNVEPSTRLRMTEVLRPRAQAPGANTVPHTGASAQPAPERPPRRWRPRNG